MQIEIRRTSEITIPEWEIYITAFNEVFEKKYLIEYFKQKYKNTIEGYSYHAFLKSDDNVVGGCTVIPYEYYFENKIIKIGLAVDVFILPVFRTDPLALFRMYKQLKKELIVQDIALVIAVPNDTAYPYWKNVVKWKDVGFLNYYTLPLKMGSILSKIPTVINHLSYVYSRIMIFLSLFLYSTERKCKIRINRNQKIIESQRYNQEHIQIREGNTFASYRIINEDGVNTCYLIDFYNIGKGIKDAPTLRKVIKKIITSESVDIIIFVGKLMFNQILLLKVPFKFEPKHLYFTADILIPNKIDSHLIYDIKNWDFGLFNYDVR
ncbi:MAG: hypothetical protein ACOYLE_01335 [Bacteroidales bacterium]